MALNEILHEMEETARRDGVATYRTLQRGLWVRMTPAADGDMMVCALARVVPARPSDTECKTIEQALAPVFVDRWVDSTNVRGPQDRRYNVRSATYTRLY